MVSSLADMATLEHGGRRCCIKIGHTPLEEINKCAVQSRNLLFHHGFETPSSYLLLVVHVVFLQVLPTPFLIMLQFRPILQY